MGARRRATVLLGVVALVAALLVPGAAAQPDAGCGPVVPLDEVARGMRARGLTVVQGSTPTGFDVEVLGVLADGVAPGRDMIIVEATSPAIEEAGGIWQGMSGSPVYVGDRLLGAVAFGLAFTSSTIGGLTAGEDVVELLEYPDGPSGQAAFAGAGAPAREVELAGDLAAEVRARTGGTGPAFAAEGRVALRRLALPLSVSGLAPDRLEALQQRRADAGEDVVAYAGSSAAYAQGAGAAAPVAGGNLAAARSLGDLTVAAVGTATAVCDGRVLGFGHPIALEGPADAGGTTAEAITIVPDDSFAPFKLANVGDLFGTMDQDRFAGIRVRTDVLPDAHPVTSRVRDLDLDRSRRGRTDVLSPEAVPDLAAFHLLANLDTTIDRLGPGTSTVAYTIRGEAEQAGAFELTREDVHASDFDVAFESIFPLLGDAAALARFPLDEVVLDAVDVTASVEEAVATYEIVEVALGVDGAPPEPAGPELLVRPGSAIDVVVGLRASGDGSERQVALQAVVPDDAFGFGVLEVAGGAGSLGGECAFVPEGCGVGVETLEELIEQIESRPRSDAVTATISTQGFDGGGPPAPGPQPSPDGPEPDQPGEVPTAEPTPAPDPQGSSGSSGARSGGPGAGRGGPAYAQQSEPVQSSVQLDRVVRGGIAVGLLIDSPICPGCPPAFARTAGADRIGTSQAIAGFAFGVADTVVLAPAEDYAPALVAGPLAALRRAPVLLVGAGGLDAGTADAIRQLGATSAIVVAPDGQLGGDLEARLGDAGVTAVERIGGADRYALAGNVAAALAAQGGAPGVAWLVEGENADPSRGWPDAVAAGPVAAYEGAPVLLTRAGDLPPATGQALDQLGVTDVVIAGGTRAVSQAVEDDLVGRGIAVDRVAGATRYETAYALVQRAVTRGALPQVTWLATGGAFADALAAGPAVAATGGVLMLVDGRDLAASPPAVQHLRDIAHTAPLVTFVGGFDAIDQVVEEQAFLILTGQEDGGGGAGGGGGSGGGGGGAPPPGPGEGPGAPSQPAEPAPEEEPV